MPVFVPPRSWRVAISSVPTKASIQLTFGLSVFNSLWPWPNVVETLCVLSFWGSAYRPKVSFATSCFVFFTHFISCLNVALLLETIRTIFLHVSVAVWQCTTNCWVGARYEIVLLFNNVVHLNVLCKDFLKRCTKAQIQQLLSIDDVFIRVSVVD